MKQNEPTIEDELWFNGLPVEDKKRIQRLYEGGVLVRLLDWFFDIPYLPFYYKVGQPR